jgi:uncharacterized protein
MNSIRQQKKIDATDKYILGSRQPIPDHQLQLGRFYALDGSLGASLYVDVSTPHVVLIAGKRGYGKSYTMGVFFEEFTRLPKPVRNNYSCIVIDTLGIFWTLAYPNKKQESLLNTWKKTKEETPVRILHTAKKTPLIYSQLTEHHLRLPPHLISIDQWCHLFQISTVQPEGMLLFRAILTLQAKNIPYGLMDIKEQLNVIPNAKKETIHTIENFLLQAESWNLFSKSAEPLSQLINPGEITIIDLSYLESTHLKQIITGIIAELLFYHRIHQRKTEEYHHITQQENTDKSPYIWLAIDEAHLFLPQHESSYVKQILLHNWLRQGRQPGLSVILATQRPSFMDQEVLSHSDIVICHRLTAEEDITSLTRLRPIYMKENIQETIKQIGIKKGVALIIDDVVETSHIICIRPRYSWHGGGEPRP